MKENFKEKKTFTNFCELNFLKISEIIDEVVENLKNLFSNEHNRI